MAFDINTLFINDPSYPPLLKEITDPPQRLFWRGDVDVLSSKNLLAVVGSRKANAYGKQCIDMLLLPAVHAGIVIVSGLAYGVDSMAHRKCIDLHRPTIAVLGSGLDDASVYPPYHLTLAHSIIDCGGVVISEYEPGTPAYKSNFPQRNRIIAGLCKATLIIQASIYSGSLITGRLALEYNRDVLCVPGYISDPLSKGTNLLIMNGATPILDAGDILRAYSIQDTPVQQEHFLDELDDLKRTVCNALSSTPQHIDEIIKATSRSPQEVAASLAELELFGYVKNVGGMKYVKKI